MPSFCILRNKTTKATVLAFSLLGRSSSITTTQAFSVLTHPLTPVYSSTSTSKSTSFSHLGTFPKLHISALTLSSSASSSNESMSKKRVLVPISDGSEEIETCCITDTLTRFGADVVIASVKPDGELKCKMSRGIHVMADISIEEAVDQEWDLVALPGGMPGAEHLRDSQALESILLKQSSGNKKYAAVCASPAVVLASKGLLSKHGGGTCYPAPVFRAALKDPSDDLVVVQENLITSQGPGTSLKFAIQLGEELFGSDAADKIAKEMLVDR